jgi:hypothetical protein
MKIYFAEFGNTISWYDAPINRWVPVAEREPPEGELTYAPDGVIPLSVTDRMNDEGPEKLDIRDPDLEHFLRDSIGWCWWCYTEDCPCCWFP